MDVEKFEDLNDRLRGDMSSWPDAKRHAGKILLTSSRKAQPLIEQAWTLRAAVAVPAPSYPCGCQVPVVTKAAVRGAIAPHFQHFVSIHDPAAGTKTPY
jgi:hypothetical protein